MAEPKALHSAIFLENPDGSITEASPFTYSAEKLKGVLGRSGFIDASDSEEHPGSGIDSLSRGLYQEVEFLYTRHERVVFLLLFTLLSFEILYDVVYVVRMDASVVEFLAMYNWHVSKKSAELIFWSVFVLQIMYSMGYYIIAFAAMWTKRPKMYRLFANWSLVGIVTLVLLAYIDKFNLLIFFLRLLAYIYARFLQGLTASLLLLPPMSPA